MLKKIGKTLRKSPISGTTFFTAIGAGIGSVLIYNDWRRGLSTNLSTIQDCLSMLLLFTFTGTGVGSAVDSIFFKKPIIPLTLLGVEVGFIGSLIANTMPMYKPQTQDLVNLFSTEVSLESLMSSIKPLYNPPVQNLIFFILLSAFVGGGIGTALHKAAEYNYTLFYNKNINSDENENESSNMQNS